MRTYHGSTALAGQGKINVLLYSGRRKASRHQRIFSVVSVNWQRRADGVIRPIEQVESAQIVNCAPRVSLTWQPVK